MQDGYQFIKKIKSAQSGITLFESLVALVILTLGVLGLAGAQMRLLTETRTTDARAIAIRLIADLRDRIHLNARGAQPGLNPTSGLSLYSDEEEGKFTAVSEDMASLADDCKPAEMSQEVSGRPSVCTPAGQAAHDVWTWRRTVAQSLMGGAASIWQVSPQQLRIIVAWSINENTNITLTGNQNAAVTSGYQQLAAPLGVTKADGVTNLCGDAMDHLICHVDFIVIPSIK